MKEAVAKVLKKALKKLEIKITDEELFKIIEIPANSDMGDYAFPCFPLLSRLKMEPFEASLEIRAKIGDDISDFEEIQTSGPYINFFVNRVLLAKNTISDILEKKEEFGKTDTGKKKRTMVEFPSPNTNKPLHLGHLRNISIGESVSRILEYNGETVIRASLNNNRGVHICKSMLAYQKYGKNKRPNEKSDHFVGKFYVLFSKKAKTNESLETEAHELLRKWEKGDKQTLALWGQMNKWALDGFRETYKKFNLKFDKEYYESEIYTQGKELIENGLKKGVLTKEADGAISINLNKEKLGKKYLMRSDGTSLYITQDIYLALKKVKDFNLTNSIYVTGNEQDYHFKVLFSILDKLGFGSERMKHLSYGMVNLPDGKMKSREGTTVDADSIIDKVQAHSIKELKKRNKLTKKELEKRGLSITLPAIRYFLLKTDIKRDMLFDPKETVSFEGDTGPYILYAYARASSVLKKSKQKINSQFDIKELNHKELELTKKLQQFPGIVLRSYNLLNPSLIANYSYQLAQLFNEFYHACPVIGSEQEGFRIALVDSFRQVLKNSLNLLGIEAINEM